MIVPLTETISNLMENLNSDEKEEVMKRCSRAAHNHVVNKALNSNDELSRLLESLCTLVNHKDRVGILTTLSKVMGLDDYLVDSATIKNTIKE